MAARWTDTHAQGRQCDRLAARRVALRAPLRQRGHVRRDERRHHDVQDGQRGQHPLPGHWCAATKAAAPTLRQRRTANPPTRGACVGRSPMASLERRASAYAGRGVDALHALLNKPIETMRTRRAELVFILPHRCRPLPVAENRYGGFARLQAAARAKRTDRSRSSCVRATARSNSMRASSAGPSFSSPRGSAVPGAVLRGRHQPRAGVVGDARARPSLERSHERILGELLRSPHVSRQTNEASDELGRLDLVDRLDDAARIFQRHASDQSTG
jgi:hypothetical protein